MTDAYILQAASRDELKHHWEDVVGMAPPSRISHSTMADILICEAQWKASGQSKAAVMRKLKHGVSAGDSNKPVANSGARLVREWNGREPSVRSRRKSPAPNGPAPASSVSPHEQGPLCHLYAQVVR